MFHKDRNGSLFNTLLERFGKIVTGRNVFVLSPLTLTINFNLHFFQDLQANSSNWLEEFCKNSLLNRWEKIREAMRVYQRCIGTSGPDSDQQGSGISRPGNKEMRRFPCSSLDSTSCHACSPLDRKKPKLGALWRWIWGTICSVISVGAFLTNKPFLTPSPDTLGFGLLKCQAHGPWTSNKVMPGKGSLDLPRE